MSLSFYASMQESSSEIINYIHDLETVNWSYGNARIMFELMGLRSDGDIVVGQFSIHEAFRALVRAKSTVEHKAPLLAREPKIEGNYIECGLSEDSIKYRVAEFERFLAAAQKAGAKTIYWA